MTRRFDGKITVITGAAGGVGLALVALFAREGARLMLADANEEGCRHAAGLATAAGADVAWEAGDLRRKTYCEHVIETTVTRFGGLDILLNNAGTIPRGSIEETTDDMWFAAMDVNLNAAFYLCRAAVPHMRHREGAAIVNTASVWGTHPAPGHIAYCTSKGALASFTQHLGRDCAPLGIRVNAVCPHEINTPMLRTGFKRRGLDPDDAIATLGRSVPLGHVAEPEEIADTIAFLASAEARYVAGALLEVTGAKPVSA